MLQLLHATSRHPLQDVVFLELAPDDFTGHWRCCNLGFGKPGVGIGGFAGLHPCTQSTKDAALELIPVEQVLQQSTKDGSCMPWCPYCLATLATAFTGSRYSLDKVMCISI